MTSNTPNENRELLKLCDEFLDRAEGLRGILAPEKIAEGKEKDGHRSEHKKKPSTSADSAESALAQLHPELLEQIKGSILKATGVTMDDVIGLDDIKNDLMETIHLIRHFPNTMADRGVNNSLMLFGVSSVYNLVQVSI